MRNRTRSPASLWAWLITLFVALVLGGCSTIKLVGDYDEQIDKGVTQLQKDVETFLVKLEATAQKPADKVENYDKNTKFYEDSKVALSGLRVRADAMERNSITVRMLDRLSKNIGRLEEMHQEGLVKAEIENSIRGALNSQFTAILTFELAKKRGEKIDDSRAQSPSTPKSTVEGDKK
ncbi:MAG: hypothetical protein A3J49_19025 [Gallionellales bacterium RIFCSPHIGHO2_02_FULL_57_16]|nr:MAG: hypothetical protein A3J49_19025 [Gallionellales bacterium RIFCSPHIGHO2_02_FULL_57_16]